MLNWSAALAMGGVSMSVDDAFPRTTRSDLLVLKELAESGAFRPVIDRRFTLDEIADAHRYVDLGHKKGNVIVTISPG
jgi:NADPH:quinone reductase-like Zn-dependent oxidoreductase